VRIEPGGREIRVAPGENVLAAALAAGIALPHSCRAGRCASCKAKLLAGEIEYPEGRPPGITALEVARGEVLLCQARPRSDLKVLTRTIDARGPGVERDVLAIERLASRALRVHLAMSLTEPRIPPGKYVDLAFDDAVARAPVVACDERSLDVEVDPSESVLYAWLLARTGAATRLRVAGPFDVPR